MIGIDYLGMGHKKWPVKETINRTPSGFGLGVFDTTFGDVLPNLKKHLRSGKFPAVRVHLWWANNHSFVPLSVIKKRAPLYEQLKKEFPNVEIYISPSCEHREKNKTKLKEAFDLLKRLAPSCIPVNSIETGARLAGIRTEVHGSKAKNAEIVSTDGGAEEGEGAYDLDIVTWLDTNKDAEIRFLWGPRFNLRAKPLPGQSLPPPKERTDIPSPGYIDGVVRLAFPIGKPSTSFGDEQPINKPNLYKTFAEDYYSKEDPRENRPVLIIPESPQWVDIITQDNKSIGKLVFGGNYGKNQGRFYSGLRGGIQLTGAQIAAKALKLSGSEWIWFSTKKRLYGPVNAAFRAGFFR